MGFSIAFLMLFISDAEVNRGCTLVLLLEDIVLAGQNCVHDDTYDGGYCEAGEGDDADADAADGVVDADCKYEDEGRYDDIAAVGEVDLILNDIADADCGDHTVEDEGYAADGCGGHCGDEGCKLRAEGEEYRKNCGYADNTGVINSGQSQNAGVLTVGGVCRCTEQRCKRGCKTVAEEGAVKSGICHVVFPAG